MLEQTLTLFETISKEDPVANDDKIRRALFHNPRTFPPRLIVVAFASLPYLGRPSLAHYRPDARPLPPTLDSTPSEKGKTHPFPYDI